MAHLKGLREDLYKVTLVFPVSCFLCLMFPFEDNIFYGIAYSVQCASAIPAAGKRRTCHTGVVGRTGYCSVSPFFHRSRVVRWLITFFYDKPKRY